MITDKAKFEKAVRRFDEENSKDPNKEMFQGQQYPRELLYSQRMTERLLSYYPKASEALQLAARSQHICRWTIPRESFPMDRKGYLRWRTELKKYHADQAADILKECDYHPESIDRVRSLILKHKLKSDSESQILEDVVCLVFLEHYFKDFSEKHQRQKIIGILRKTWNKMSEDGQSTAMSLLLPAEAKQLLEQAIEN